MAKRVAVFDPSGRLIAELAPLAEKARLVLEPIDACTDPVAVICAPAVAADLGPPPANAPPRWIVGDANNAARIAGAAAGCGATGVLLSPVSVDALLAISSGDASSTDADLSRARGLIATSLVDLTGDRKSVV